MSVCDEGWGDLIYCPALQDMGMCNLTDREAHVKFCPFAAILRALPSATPEQFSIIEAVLAGNVKPQCLICNHFFFEMTESRCGKNDKTTCHLYSCDNFTPKIPYGGSCGICKDVGADQFGCRPQDTPCPTCGGSGLTDERPFVGRVCPTCHGTGKEER